MFQFDGNPKKRNRFLSTCERLISHFYNAVNPINLQNICLLNPLVSELSSDAKI